MENPTKKSCKYYTNGIKSTFVQFFEQMLQCELCTILAWTRMDSLDTKKSLTDQWSQVKHMWRRLTSFTWDNEYFSKLIQSLDEGHFLKMVVVMQMRTHFFITWSHDIFKRGSKVVLLIVIWRWPGHVSEGSRIIIIVTCVTNFSIVFIFCFFFKFQTGFYSKTV